MGTGPPPKLLKRCAALFHPGDTFQSTVDVSLLERYVKLRAL